jgi:hypothetical protein
MNRELDPEGASAPDTLSRWKIVQRFVERGALPSLVPATIAGRLGRGERCMICGSLITLQEFAFEVPLPAGPVVLDRGCVNVWMAIIAPRS